MPIRLNEQEVYKMYKNIIKIDNRIDKLFIESSDFFIQDDNGNLNQVFDKCRYKRYPAKTCAIIGDNPFGNIEPSDELCDKYILQVLDLEIQYYENLLNSKNIINGKDIVNQFLDKVSILNISFVNDAIKEHENIKGETNAEYEINKKEMEQRR